MRIYKIDKKLKISINCLFTQIKKDLDLVCIVFDQPGDKSLILYLKFNHKDFFKLKKYLMDNLPYVQKVTYSLNKPSLIGIVFNTDIVVI